MFSRNQLIFTIIVLILSVPALLFGGRTPTTPAVVFLLSFPLVYFVFTIISGFEKMPAKKNPFLPLSLFTGLSVISYFYSAAPFQSFFGAFWQVFYFILFFSVFYFVGGYGEIKKFSSVLITLSAVLSAIGLYFFWGTEIYDYLRLVSTFYHHNAFASFLLVPVLVFCALLLSEKNEKKILKQSVLAVLFFVVFFLTYSRGGWISLLLGFAALFWFLRGKIAKINIVYFFAAVFLSIAVIYSLYFVKENQASALAPVAAEKMEIQAESSEQEKSKALTQYISDTKEENALAARLVYWRGALDIFQDNILFGAGFENYKVVYQKYLKDPRYYSVDPHNFYLKTLAELGVFGFLFWIWFCGILVFISFRSAKIAAQKGELAILGLCAGMLAFLVNIFGELSLVFPASGIMFFFTSAVLSRYYFLNSQKSQGASKIWGFVFLSRPLIEYAKYILIFISFVLFLRGFSFFVASQAIVEAKDAVKERNLKTVLQNYNLAKKADPFDFTPRKLLAQTYYEISFSGETAEKEKNINLAEKNILDVLRIEKNSSNYELYGKILSAKKGVLLEKGESKEASELLEKEISAFEKAIEFYPAGAHLSYRVLEELYFFSGEYQKAADLAEKAAGFYTNSVFESMSWINPDKEKIKNNIAAVKSYGGATFLILGEKEKAKNYFFESEKKISCVLLSKIKFEKEAVSGAKDIFGGICAK